MSAYGWPEEKAISEFMCSKVYDCLQDEETKLWHRSAHQLAGMYLDTMKFKVYCLTEGRY